MEKTSSRHFNDRHYDGIPSGPFPFLNPTHRSYSIPDRSQQAALKPKVPGQDETPNDAGSDSSNAPAAPQESKDGELSSAVDRTWRSRDNRKGRHAITVTPAADKDAQFATPPRTNSTRATLVGIWRMFSTAPYWDVSYLVAVIFTLGSVVWCFNGFFVWLPLQDPSSEFPGETANAGGITAFIGATIFEIGSILLMIEAVNENRSDCFGWALEETLEESGIIKLRPDTASCSHSHHFKHKFLHGKASAGKPSHDQTMDDKSHPESQDARTWTWWPTWYELRTHYFKEVGFLACLSQMFGATIFWISGFTALPGIFDKLSPAALNGAFWAVQVIGGSGFIVSSLLFMLETQHKWYLPAPKTLGYWIGLWNLIGAFGFTLCGALGYSTNSGVLYESSLATFWGSWAFLIGSLIQWFEALDKHPVLIEEGAGRISTTKRYNS